MKLVALFSGGKDSTYALYKAVQEGHAIAYLATIHAANPVSYMYHTENIGLTVFQAEAMGLRLVSKESTGEKEKEVHDLEVLLKGIDAEGVVCGAVRSNYQRERVEKICKSLNLRLFTPLWHADEEKYLRELVSAGFKVIITAVAAEGFDESWLGRELDEKAISDLSELKEKHGISVVGEGGEFETTVLDGPIFKKRIEIVEAQKKWEDNSGHYVISNARLVEK
jgi:diphthine-ammonia ligase